MTLMRSDANWRKGMSRQTTNGRDRRRFLHRTKERKKLSHENFLSPSSIIKSCKVTKSRTERCISIFLLLEYYQVPPHFNQLVWSNECEKRKKIPPNWQGVRTKKRSFSKLYVRLIGPRIFTHIRSFNRATDFDGDGSSFHWQMRKRKVSTGVVTNHQLD